MNSPLPAGAAAPDADATACPTPMRIAVAGAGAIGCTLAATLAHAGQPVRLLARGATLQAVQRDGIRLQRADGIVHAQVQAASDARQLGEQDAVFICTKAHDLARIVPALGPLIGPHTCIIPMVNGVPWWYFQRLPGRFAGRAVQAVDPDGALLRALPTEQLLGAVQFITAERSAPGAVSSLNPLLIILGELDHTETPRARRLADALNAAGIEARVSPRIRDPLWTKIIANLTSNPLSVIAEATLEALYGDPRLLPVVRKILHEGLTLAASYGARIEFDPQTFISQALGMGPVRTSMLQDALQGNPLELAAIGDAVLELARLQQIPMPVAQDIIAMAHYRSEHARSPAPRPPAPH